MVKGSAVVVIIVLIIITALLLVGSFYLLAHYQHPDDKNDAFFPKVVVILGLSLAGLTVLAFPFDIIINANGGCDNFDPNSCIGLNMELFWDVIFWAIPIWIFVLIPFSTYYYEADDEYSLAIMVGAVPSRLTPRSRVTQAFCSLTFVLVIVVLIFGLTYLFLKETIIPVNVYEYTENDLPITKNFSQDKSALVNDLEEIIGSFKNGSEINPSVSEETLRVSLETFFAGLMAWIGWFFFAIFGGVGIPSIPLDFIFGFINRPRYMNPEESEEAKEGLKKRVNEMVELGEQIKRDREESGKLDDSRLSGGVGGVFNSLKDSRTERKTMREFKAAVFLLEKDTEDFTAASNESEKYNPLLPWFSLFVGVLSSVISLAWFFHIALFLIPSQPLSPFLNSYLSIFNFFPPVGIIMVSVFAFYLLLCAVKGCIKVGLRFLCMTIHPMEKGKTYMSSLMFNVGLVLMCCLPVIQFCAQSFAIYARYSTARQLFGVQIEHLEFFSFFWEEKIFIYVMFAIIILTSFWLIFTKSRKSDSTQLLSDRLRLRS